MDYNDINLRWTEYYNSLEMTKFNSYPTKIILKQLSNYLSNIMSLYEFDQWSGVHGETWKHPPKQQDVHRYIGLVARMYADAKVAVNVKHVPCAHR